MIESLVTLGQWLGLIVFVYCACLVITCAAEDIHDVRTTSAGPLNIHDWDAADRALERRQRLDS